VPETFPQQRTKVPAVKQAVLDLAASKVKQEADAARIARTGKSPEERQLARAMELSNKMMAEDLYREVGYMVPQNTDTRELLKTLLKNPPSDFPKQDAEELLKLLSR
jgi:D-alanyl-D-alanine carboxypeptidase